RHTRWPRDWSSDVCSSDLTEKAIMRTEKEKMLAGELYDPLDSELVQARDRARDLCQDLNSSRERDQDARRSILKQLFGQGGESEIGRASCRERVEVAVVGG